MLKLSLIALIFLNLFQNCFLKQENDSINIKKYEIVHESVRATQYPCECASGQCSCCTGFLLSQLNQKGCFNITYIPDEFAFKMAVIVNERVLYKNKVSGQNPPPVCVRLPRFRQVRFCARFSNIYFNGPNMHVCIDADMNWSNFQLFQTSFDCFRIGANGVAHVAPEDGGGFPNIFGEDDDDDDVEDYDENV